MCNTTNEKNRRYCLDCGDEIPKQRLKHVPHAVRCVSCQSVRESLVPNLIARIIDEGIAGAREKHQWVYQREAKYSSPNEDMWRRVI